MWAAVEKAALLYVAEWCDENGVTFGPPKVQDFAEQVRIDRAWLAQKYPDKFQLDDDDNQPEQDNQP